MNADGRCDAPLLCGGELMPGIYEIAFEVGAYRSRRDGAGNPADFLDTVPVRFRIPPPGGTAPAHLHVPLLIAPYGYSTYRGS